MPIKDRSGLSVHLHGHHTPSECNVLSEGIELLFAERREDLEGS
jgi:hypothetical protein